MLEVVEQIATNRKPVSIENNGRCYGAFNKVSRGVRELPCIRQGSVWKVIILSEICDMKLAFKLRRPSRMGDDFKQPDGLRSGKGFILVQVAGHKAFCRKGHLLVVNKLGL